MSMEIVFATVSDVLSLSRTRGIFACPHPPAVSSSPLFAEANAAINHPTMPDLGIVATPRKIYFREIPFYFVRQFDTYELAYTAPPGTFIRDIMTVRLDTEGMLAIAKVRVLLSNGDI